MKNLSVTSILYHKKKKKTIEKIENSFDFMTKSCDSRKKAKISYDVLSLAPSKKLLCEHSEIEDILCFAPPFAVSGFARNKRRDCQVLRHVNFSGFALHFLCSGRFFCRFDGKEIMMNPGDVFLEPTDSNVEMGMPEGYESDRLILFLRGSLLSALTRRLGLLSPLLIHPENPEEMRTRFEEFRSLLQDEKQLPLLIGRTAELLTCLAEIHGTFRKGLPDKMAWALHYIQRNLQNGFTPAELSKYLELPQSAVKKQFAASFGCTPLELLRKERMKYAAEMLESGQMSIKEISLQCGFSTLCYFSSAFRKAYQMSPREYLKSRCGKTKKHSANK